MDHMLEPQISNDANQKSNSIIQEWCNNQKEIFQEEIYPFNEFGGMASMSRDMNLGMVIVMSLWDDHHANMLWLDSNYPTGQDPEKPGIARGECDIPSGVPVDIESTNPNAQVVFSNIKFGPIRSIFVQPAIHLLATRNRCHCLSFVSVS
ncbi:hypothetical protein G6011_03716 [Alternaria panax]|uniref:Glucanase n=1 Tax=Alternaria panax TaxID=48097 RepID=A0AAD4IFX9_9PLEO|nr:hypothetical protein G6011_03716 [Alternaria panax]